MTNPHETWQIEVNNQIYEANVEELSRWIAEGALLPADRVRRGNLRWIEARKVPLLTQFFNHVENNLPFPVLQTVTEASAADADLQLRAENTSNALTINQNEFIESPKNFQAANQSFNSPALKSPSSNQRRANKRFGFADFGRALAYPFKFRSSLILGAVLFMIFTVGQTATAFGGMFLFALGIVCSTFANALTFACLANTLDNFSQGKLEANFMPQFDDFELWGDVIQPFFLSIGVYIVSFGLLIVLLVAAFYYAQQSFEQIETDKQKIVSAVFPDAQTESVAGKTSETEREGYNQIAANLLRLSLIFSIPIFLAFLWGVFYFPAACAVAGYTRSFAAVVNPLVGLDTIRRMGYNYAKILLMFFALGVFSLAVGGVLSVVFSSFDMPSVGNLPARAVGGLFTFYFSVVFSVVLGYALYKCYDRLNLHRG